MLIRLESKAKMGGLDEERERSLLQMLQWQELARSRIYKKGKLPISNENAHRRRS